MPYLDAMAAGWVLPMPYDVRLVVSDDGRNVQFSWPTMEPLDDGFAPAIVAHEPFKYGEVFAKPPFKVDTPYYLSSAGNVQSLVGDVLNRQSHLRVVAGVLNTSAMPFRINFNVWWDGPDGDHLIKAGTPVAQVLPLVGRAPSMRLRNIPRREVARWHTALRAFQVVPGYYKAHLRSQ